MVAGSSGPTLVLKKVALPFGRHFLVGFTVREGRTIFGTKSHEIDVSIPHTSIGNCRFGVHECVMSLYVFRTNQSVVIETTEQKLM